MHSTDHVVPHDEIRERRVRIGAQHFRQVVAVEDVEHCRAVSDVGANHAVEVVEGLAERGDHIDGEVGGQRGVAVDEHGGPQFLDGAQRVDQPFGGAFGEERRTEMGHQHVADEGDAPVGEVDQQCVVGLAAVHRKQPEVHAADGQCPRLGDEMVGLGVHMVVGIGGHESLPRQRQVVLVRYFLGEAGLGDHLDPGLAQRVQAADVVEVPMGQDHVADRERRPGADGPQRRSRVVLGAAHVDDQQRASVATKAISAKS